MKLNTHTVLLAGLLFAPAVLAVPPHQPNLTDGGSLWLMNAYDDTHPAHRQIFREEICFRLIGNVGTHTRYAWQSLTYPAFKGIATQEGDHVMMHGDFSSQGNGIYHDAWVFDLVTESNKDLGAGHWTMWKEDGNFGSTLYSANVTLARQPDSQCGISAPIDDAKQLSAPAFDPK
jgi:hypothetical protein